MLRAEVKGLEGLLRSLADRGAKARRDGAFRGEVGYSADYATVVHEDMQRRHPQGQAKFLEQPAREMAREMADMTAEGLRRGKTLAEAARPGLERLKAASQALCPVETGALRESAYVSVEGG